MRRDIKPIPFPCKVVGNARKRNSRREKGPHMFLGAREHVRPCPIPERWACVFGRRGERGRVDGSKHSDMRIPSEAPNQGIDRSMDSKSVRGDVAAEHDREGG